MRHGSWALLGLAVACGGKAVIDADGATGAGGTSSGQGAGSMSAPASNVSSTSSSMTSLCDQACAAIAQCLRSDVDCVAGCTETRPGCEGPRDEFLECYLAGSNTELCSMPADCDGELYEMQACDGGFVGATACSGGMGNSCSCFNNDDQGTRYESFCEGFGDTARCECEVDGQPIGSCVHPGPVFEACDRLYGCCTGLFYITR